MRTPTPLASFLTGILAALLLVSCNGLPDPAVAPRSDIELDTAGLTRDSYGIWRDPNLDNRPFADMPLAYREFWRYCFSCHSSSGQKKEAREARRAVRIDTWREVLAYGPEKLLLAAKSGGMPPPSSPRIPPEVLDRVQAYLATWGDSTPTPALFDFRYTEAERFVRVYCADCHSPAGMHERQPEATARMILDNYATWHRQQASIAGWLDSLFPGMPPDYYAHQPTPEERRAMLVWIDSLSPNNKTGSGHGAPLAPAGALTGSRYDTATALVRKYCADCHTEGGFNARQWDGWAAVQFDSYAQWKAYEKVDLIHRIDPDSLEILGGNPMPPPEYRPQPDSAERSVLVEWLKRGSPNTATGR